MTKDELAAKINGRQIGKEITGAEINAAKKAGLVVVYGASDDLMEFEGAISDEVGAYEGGEAFILDGELLTDDNGCESECKWFMAARKNAVKIEACWDESPFTWTYETDIPHATFEIYEGKEKYCRGIVFKLSEVK